MTIYDFLCFLTGLWMSESNRMTDLTAKLLCKTRATRKSSPKDLFFPQRIHDGSAVPWHMRLMKDEPMVWLCWTLAFSQDIDQIWYKQKINFCRSSLLQSFAVVGKFYLRKVSRNGHHTVSSFVKVGTSQFYLYENPNARMMKITHRYSNYDYIKCF